VQRAVLHVDGHHAAARAAVVHDQIQRKVLHKVAGIERQGAAVQGVQQRVAGAVGGARAPIRLPTLAKLQALAAECALVDTSLVVTRERQAIVLQLIHRAARDEGGGGGEAWGLHGNWHGLRLHASPWRLAAHVMDGILVTQPIAALHRVVHVPPPVVHGAVAQSRIDAALQHRRTHESRVRRARMRAAWSPPAPSPHRTCAATVWERVGNSLVMTAVLNPCSARPMAARRPAPPAPTTTASNVWSTAHVTQQPIARDRGASHYHPARQQLPPPRTHRWGKPCWTRWRWRPALPSHVPVQQRHGQRCARPWRPVRRRDGARAMTSRQYALIAP